MSDKAKLVVMPRLFLEHKTDHKTNNNENNDGDNPGKYHTQSRLGSLTFNNDHDIILVQRSMVK